MPALNYQARFANDVESGAKGQTVRKRRKCPIKIGDTLYHFTGMRTKACRRLRIDVCTKITTVEINGYGLLLLDGVAQTEHESQRFAELDGFADYDEMLAWVYKAYGIPFLGDAIYWNPKAPACLTCLLQAGGDTSQNDHRRKSDA